MRQSQNERLVYTRADDVQFDHSEAGGKPFDLSDAAVADSTDHPRVPRGHPKRAGSFASKGSKEAKRKLEAHASGSAQPGGPDEDDPEGRLRNLLAKPGHGG